MSPKWFLLLGIFATLLHLVPSTVLLSGISGIGFPLAFGTGTPTVTAFIGSGTLAAAAGLAGLAGLAGIAALGAAAAVVSYKKKGGYKDDQSYYNYYDDSYYTNEIYQEPIQQTVAYQEPYQEPAQPTTTYQEPVHQASFHHRAQQPAYHGHQQAHQPAHQQAHHGHQIQHQAQHPHHDHNQQNQGHVSESSYAVVPHHRRRKRSAKISPKQLDNIFNEIAKADTNGCGLRLVCDLYKSDDQSITGIEFAIKQLIGPHPKPVLFGQKTPRAMYTTAAMLGLHKNDCDSIYHYCPVSTKVARKHLNNLII